MKRLRMGLAVLGILALVVAVLVNGKAFVLGDSDPLSRLSPLSVSGPGVLSPAEVSAILQQSSTGPVAIQSVQNDTSNALQAMPPIPPQKSHPDPDLNELRPLPNRGGGPVGLQAETLDPALQAADVNGAVTLAIPTPLQNFEGVSNVNGVLPPDTNGDVGPNHYMQWVNLSFAIYSKTGTLLYGPAAGNTLWQGFGGACETTNDGDPIVQYDHLADRWMVSQFALPNYPSGPYYECIAVSQTNDPTGAWYRYAFQISATKMNDYPHFGVWPDGYYMSVNQFVNGSTWGGAGAVVFERDKMLLGQPAQAVYFDMYSVDPNLGGMLPSDLDGPVPPAGTPNYFAEMDDDAWGYSPDQVQVWAFHVDWTTPSNSTLTQVAALPTAAFDTNMCAGSRNCIPQSGTTRKLDAIADRLMYRLQYRNFGAHQSMVVNHTVDVNGADRAGIRWYELRNTGSGWSIYQQGTFSPDATHRWMGSIAMDGLGNMAVGYSASSSTIFPAIRYTGRLVDDPLGTLSQGEGTLINGTGSQTHTASRWGDYSMMAVDPVDDCTFWYTNEYLQTTSLSSWRTRIGSFQLPGCGGAPTTGTLEGTVIDANTSAPISGATVTIVGGSSTTTNASGFYQFPSVTAGTYSVTAAQTGYNNTTNTGVVVSAGSTTTSNFALTPVAAGNTGFLIATANASQTGGDNNGYQTSPANAYLDDGVFAVDTNSGTNSNSSCTNKGKDAHRFYNYGINIPGTTVTGIEVRVDARVDATAGSPKICVQLSWNGGTSWTAAKQTTTLSTAEQTFSLGSPTDTWGRTWSLSDFSNANFRLRVIDVATNTSRDFSLDWITIRLTYQ
ncbi:MAG: carboxypeptidase-like regulatory domain-containing protein [Chloroflexota bacterium]